MGANLFAPPSPQEIQEASSAALFSPPTPDELQQISESGPGAAQSALEHYGNAATLGYLPHLQALVEKLTPDPNAQVDAALKSQGFKIDQPEQSYVASRDANAKRLGLESKQHPYASGAGTIAGMIGSGVIANAALPAAAPAADFADRVAQGVKAGWAYGAASNPGDVEGVVDPIQFDQRLLNGGLGAAVGGGTSMALEGASAGSKLLSDWLKNRAARNAVKAIDARGPKLEKLIDMGADKELGRTLLDEGAIPILGTPKRIARRVEALKEEAGSEIGNMLKQAGDKKRIDASEIALNLLDDPAIAALRKTPGMEGVSNQVEKLADTLSANGEMSLEQAQALRKSIDDSINFSKKTMDMSGNQKILYNIRTRLRDKMNDAINALEGSGLEKDALKKTNRKYSLLSDASDFLDKKVARDQANRDLSLTDTIAGAGGAVAGPLGSAITAGLNKAARTFGDSAAARSQDAASNLLNSFTGKLELAKASPATLQAMLASISPSESRPAPGNEILDNPQLLQFFKENPNMLEQAVSDPKIREEIRKKLKREPAGKNAVRLKALEE